jgi:hypothetical protein
MRGLRSIYALLALLDWSSIVLATPSTIPPDSETLAARKYFYVGGNYVSTDSGTLFVNQMYVEQLTPTKPSQKYPLALIHGEAQTGTVHDHPSLIFKKYAADTRFVELARQARWWCRLGDVFLNQGYTLYIIDQTERARSAWNPAGNTTMTTYSVELIEQHFTAVKKFALWPQAQLHTQWPGVSITPLLIRLI